MMKTNIAIAYLALFHFSATAHAVVTFDWATVGNPGNPPDLLYSNPDWNPNNLRFGAVSYTFRISKTEVTNDQYTEFLNAVDPMGTNPNSVYNSNMGSNARGGIAFDAGVPSGSKYSSKTNMGNKPVNYVSFFDSMRFVNWLENGQPTGGSGAESGVYTIGNGLNETRAPGATFFIPSEDEWYKAAYHQPADQGGDADNYWLYPTASNSVVTVATANTVGDISNPGANVANYFRGADWNGQNGNVTTVGSAGPLSASFYGTFDQGGNVYEWNEAVIVLSDRTVRCVRGGSYANSIITLDPSVRGLADPAFEDDDRSGFRVASIPETSLSCDFNSDAACNIVDLNAMLAEGPIAPGVTVTPGVNGQFDLTGDGVIDNADADEWLSEAATANQLGSPYKRGDANLDGFVDGSDFGLWNAGKFTSTLAWDRGDFSGDGVADGSDFGIWNSNKFTSSDGASAVPEPVASALAFVTALLCGGKRGQVSMVRSTRRAVPAIET
jgi:formylglycine-generating enzyme required for sulfatase activity